MAATTKKAKGSLRRAAEKTLSGHYAKLSPKTYQWAENTLMPIVAWFEARGLYDTKDIEFEHEEELFKFWSTQRDNSIFTLNNKRSILRQLWKTAGRGELMVSSKPMRRATVWSLPPSSIEPLCHHLWGVPEARILAAHVLWSVFTGMKPEDTLRIGKEDVDYKACEVAVPGADVSIPVNGVAVEAARFLVNNSDGRMDARTLKHLWEYQARPFLAGARKDDGSITFSSVLRASEAFCAACGLTEHHSRRLTEKWKVHPIVKYIHTEPYSGQLLDENWTRCVSAIVSSRWYMEMVRTAA